MTTKPSVIPKGTKWCNGCSQLHGRMAFTSDTSRPDGLQRRCRMCDNRRRTKQQFDARLAVNPNATFRARIAAYPDAAERVLGTVLVQRMAAVAAEADAKRAVTVAKAKATRAFNMSAMVAASAARTALRT